MSMPIPDGFFAINNQFLANGPNGFAECKMLENEDLFVRMGLPGVPEEGVNVSVDPSKKAVIVYGEAPKIHTHESSDCKYIAIVGLICQCCEISGFTFYISDGVLRLLLSKTSIINPQPSSCIWFLAGPEVLRNPYFPAKASILPLVSSVSQQLPRTSEIKSWNERFLQEQKIRKSVKKEIQDTEPCSNIFRVKIRNDEVYMLWDVPEEEPSQELFAENWKESSGPVRNQRSHDNCSTYVGTMRLLTKKDGKFRIFSARYLTFYASPMLRYVESTDGRRKDQHHCHGNTIAATLKFIKENGVPEEDPIDAEKDFNCITDAPKQNPSILYQIGDEVQVCVSNKLKDLYEALLHQPVGANLHFFHPEFTNIGSDIYQGPLSDASTYSGLHTVLVIAIKRSKGKLVAVVKSSHGTEKGKKGYMKVSLTRMILGIGRGNEIESASFLLTDFTYLEIPRGLNKPEESEKEKRKRRKTHHLPCLAFPDPETSVQRLLEELASKDWVKVCESLNNTRRFAAYHSSLLLPILEKLIVVMVMVMKNPRTAVCITWIMTCSDIFNAYGDKLLEEPHLKSMDHLLLQLLTKASQNKKFVCEEADKALNTMVNSVARLPLLRKLQTYVRHSNPRVRAKAAVYTSKCVSKMEPSEIEEFGMVPLAQMAADLLSDKFPDAREAARSLVIWVYDKFKEEDEGGNKQKKWQRFCENHVTGFNAQAMIKIVSSMEVRNIENILKIIQAFKD